VCNAALYVQVILGLIMSLIKVEHLIRATIRISETRFRGADSLDPVEIGTSFSDPVKIAGLVGHGHVERGRGSNPALPYCESGELTTTQLRP